MTGWSALLVTLASLLGTRAVLMLAGAVRAARDGGPLADAVALAAADPLNLAVAQAAAIAAAVALGLRLDRRGLPTGEALGLRAAGPATLAAALVAGAALQFPLAELGNLLRELHPLSLEQQLALRALVTPEGLPSALAALLAVVVVAPVGEELLFRGLVMPALRARYETATALAGSAALFGLSHVEPVAATGAAVAGLVLGAVALRTGSAWPAVAMHAGVNAVPLLLPDRVLRIPGFNTVGEDVYHLPAPLLVGSGVVALAAVAALVHVSDRESE